MSAPPDPPRHAVPDEIGPTTGRSPVVPLLALIPAGLMLWIGIDLWRMDGGREPGVLAVVAGGAALCVGVAALAWYGQPFVQARVVFHDDGVEVAQWGRLTRGLGPQRVGWDDIVGIRHLSLRATHSQLGLELSREGMIARGMAQPTLREGGPRWLARRTLWLSLPALDLPAERALEAFVAQARRAGCEVTYRGGEYGVATNRLWDVRAPGGGEFSSENSGTGGAGGAA